MVPMRMSLNAVLALTLAGAVFAVPTLARAGDDDEVPLDTRIVRGIMEDLGLKSGREASINYQERAPLVIPPNTDLPPPQKPGAAIANNPAWPKDPDVARAKLERDQEKDRDIGAEIEREENPLPRDQLDPKGKASKVARTSSTNSGSVWDGDQHYRMTPAQLGYHGGLFGLFSSKDDSANAKFTGEPKRSSLTEPPVGYQTPSPDQPYGLGKSVAAPKATNSYQTHGEVNADTR
jgi:hypothetical protein